MDTLMRMQYRAVFLLVVMAAVGCTDDRARSANGNAQGMPLTKQLAEQGEASSEYYLGLAYSEGRLVPQDYVEAHKWLNIAASRANGDDREEYATARDAVAGKMARADVVEAQKRAREWTEAFERRKP